MAKLHKFNKVALIQHSKHAVNGRLGYSRVLRGFRANGSFF